LSAARIVEVAVQLPVYGTYTYRLPPLAGTVATVGTRVLVPFGNRGVSGVIVGDAAEIPAVGKLRDIDAVVDPEPLVPRDVVALCLWMAEYYEAPPGEVLKAALPVGAAVAGAQQVVLTDAGQRAARGEGGALPPKLRDLVAVLGRAGGVLAQKKLLAGRATTADVEALGQAGLVRVERQFARERVRDKTIRVARLARPLDDEARAVLARKKRQLEVLEVLAELGGEADVTALKTRVPRASEHVRALGKDGWIEISERVVRGDAWGDKGDELGVAAPARAPELHPRQRAAVDAITTAFREQRFASFLLHGITGSGKTEVYLGAIAEVLEAGRGAIVLVPEISLTPQLASRFRARFGDAVAVLHSGLTDRERFDEWYRIREGQARIALGARSAVFAPVRDLGMVIVDEEHDSSFKQEEGVRYSARDVALVRAQRADAVCVLGSATPSMESYRSAEVGRHTLIELPERATPKPLPEVEIVDLKKYKVDADTLLSAPLAAAIGETLARGEQVILFLNRRGFNTFVVCTACGEAFRCTECSVSLTYHRYLDRLVCHHCGLSKVVPERCPSCSAEAIVKRGLGTERVAEGVAERFPDARVDRLDRDVAAARGIHTVLGRFARHESDILVGTQMVTKGHDFPGVTLVGVLSADAALSLPDFRASERTFQLLAQVAGRAGRGDRPGRVLIQTYRPEASAIVAAREHDYPGFYRQELQSRDELGYPPMGHLVAVRIDGKHAPEVEAAARALAQRARRSMADGSEVRLLGPAEAPLSRLQGRTRWHLWLSARDRKKLRLVVRETVRGLEVPRGVRITVDVDPVSAL